MSRPDPALFALYRRALALYPAHVRARNQAQMLQTVRDADAERSCSAARFWLYLFTDLLQSSAKERLSMVRKQIFARPVATYTLALGLLFTLFGFPAALTIQGALRAAANQPQIQMAQQYASRIAAGDPLDTVLPSASIDIEQSLEPFAIYYNDQGEPVAGTGLLGARKRTACIAKDGVPSLCLSHAIPAPPPGVFAYLRTHSTDKITWQPQPGVRIAAVVERVEGPHPGFLLAGRSLAPFQQQDNQLRRATFLTWFFLMAVLIAGGALLNRVQSRPAFAS